MVDKSPSAVHEQVPECGVIGIDIGGTTVKGGLLLPDGSRRVASPLPTQLGSGASTFLDNLAHWIGELGSTCPLGIGVPGVFVPGTRKLADTPNLGALVGCDLAQELGLRLGREAPSIAVGNDANLAALGEQWMGAGRGHENLVMVTLGTGVGGGIILNGQLFEGSAGRGGEVGHIKIHEGGLAPIACGCGNFGCLETFASASAAQRLAREAGLPTDLDSLADAARNTHGPERVLLESIGKDLGRGLAQILILLDIETFVIGGGFGAALDILLPGIHEGIAERDFTSRTPRILAAQLGANAGWLGAARYALQAGR